MDISEWEQLLHTNPITLDPTEQVSTAGSGVLYVSQSQALKEAMGEWVAKKRAQGFELLGVTRPNTSNPDTPDGHGYFHEVQITFKSRSKGRQHPTNHSQVIMKRRSAIHLVSSAATDRDITEGSLLLTETLVGACVPFGRVSWRLLRLSCQGRQRMYR